MLLFIQNKSGMSSGSMSCIHKYLTSLGFQNA
uniref:Uncharacterized protein n=1 Tax=Lepeophtheirus salmonis TaxID=72036 RepID=A0A0K2V2M2_LEPSM